MVGGYAKYDSGGRAVVLITFLRWYSRWMTCANHDFLVRIIRFVVIVDDCLTSITIGEKLNLFVFGIFAQRHFLKCQLKRHAFIWASVMITIILIDILECACVPVRGCMLIWGNSKGHRARILGRYNSLASGCGQSFHLISARRFLFKFPIFVLWVGWEDSAIV